MRTWLLVLAGIVIMGCTHAPAHPAQPSFKDSVLKKHLAFIDSLDFYDTTNYDYRVLKAYFNDDTTFFTDLNRFIDQYVPRRAFLSLDSSVYLKKLSDLGVDEAFRFIHSQSFCDLGQEITITRAGDSIRLSYIEYSVRGYDGEREEYMVNGKHDTITANRDLLKKVDKRLTLKDWEGLENRLSDADYWGLRTSEYHLVLDGSQWQIDGYTKRPRYGDNRQIHSVHRNSGSPAFFEIGKYLLKLSGEKTMCERFF